jgi:hypothetical protein
VVRSLEGTIVHLEVIGYWTMAPAGGLIRLETISQKNRRPYLALAGHGGPADRAVVERIPTVAAASGMVGYRSGVTGLQRCDRVRAATGAMHVSSMPLGG